MPTGQVDRGIAHHDGVWAHKWGDQPYELGSKPLVFTDVACADVDMGESRRMWNLAPHHRQGVATVAQDQELSRRDAIGMRSELAIEYVNLALGHDLAQVIIGAAVAEAELEHRPGHIPDQLGRTIEAGALRPHAANEAIEAAHSHPNKTVMSQHIPELSAA
jgi:hypothetical protein